jgi:hypothetical protein
MTDETNGVAAPVAPAELKSIDTSSKAKEANIEASKPVVVAKVKPESAEPATPPEGVVDAPDADSPTGKQRMPRWMKERLERERQVTEARTREAVTREFLERTPAQPSDAARPQAEPEKTLMDFDFDQNKFTDYLVDKKLKDRDERQHREAEQKKQAEAHESFKSHVDAFESKVGDGAWEEIVESPLNTKPEYKPLTELFMGDEHDLEIAHYLATNMKEAERINALPRLQQVREIAKLADRFEGSAEETPDKPVAAPRKTTSAPPPVKTISGAGKPSVDIRDPGMSTADRIKAWKKQGGR